MKFIIIGKNIDVTPGLREAVEIRKVRKVLHSEYRDPCNLKRTKRASEDRSNYSCKGWNGSF